MFDDVFIIYDGDKQGQTYYLDKLLTIEDKAITFLAKNFEDKLFTLNIPNFIKDPQSNIEQPFRPLSGWLYTNNYFITPNIIKKSLKPEEIISKKIEPMIEYCHSAYISPVKINQLNYSYNKIIRYKKRSIAKKITYFFQYLKKI